MDLPPLAGKSCPVDEAVSGGHFVKDAAGTADYEGNCWPGAANIPSAQDRVAMNLKRNLYPPEEGAPAATNFWDPIPLTGFCFKRPLIRPRMSALQGWPPFRPLAIARPVFILNEGLMV